MNILILGGLGFLGRNIANELSQTNNVFIVDCIDFKMKDYYKIKFSDIESVKKVVEENNINMVLHLISSIIPSSSAEAYLNEISEVYNPTLQLLDYCSEKGIKFVYFSSGGAVYGNQKEIFNEHTKCEPVSYYGLSKLNLENAVLFFHNTKGLEYLIIRPSNPYGYGQNLFGKQGLIAVIFGKILKKETLQIWGDGSAIKDYIYIDDFVYYVTNLINQNKAWNQIFNVGSGKGESVKDVLLALKKNHIDLPKIDFITEKSSDVKRMILDCSKLQELIPYETTSLEDGINKFWITLKETGCKND